METTAPLLGEPLPVELMNTIWADRDGVHDALATPADAAAWVRAIAGRIDVDVPGLTFAGSEEEWAPVHAGLRRLRDAARSLAARRTEDPRAAGTMPIDAAEALATVNDLASSAPAWPVLRWSGQGEPAVVRASDAAPGAVLVADIARATVELLGGDASSRLRACVAPGCVLYFVKHHPRREWCSDACGNRARQARHYQRSRATR